MVETYSYDSQNCLIGYTNGTTSASYAYDALDRRIAKTVDAAVASYVYDTSMEDPLAFDDILLEFDASAPSPILTRRWLQSNAVDEPLGFESYAASPGVRSGTEHSMFADRQGSVIWVTEPATGQVVAAYEYDGYGQITQTQGTLKQPYGYTGREYDAESGLYHYRARAYDPKAGVFVQVDPIKFGSDVVNLTNYASDNPFNLRDPSGLTQIWALQQQGGSAAASGLLGVTGIGVGTIKLSGLISRYLSGIEGNSYQWAIKTEQKNTTCSPAVRAAFASMKNHKTGSCEYGKMPAENLRIMSGISASIFVRTGEAETCFAGGDSGHNAQVAMLWGNLKSCHGILTKAWKLKK